MQLRDLINETNAEIIRKRLSDLPIFYGSSDAVERNQIIEALHFFVDIAEEASGQRFFTERKASILATLRDIQAKVTALTTSQAQFDTILDATNAAVTTLVQSTLDLVNVAEAIHAAYSALITNQTNGLPVDLTAEAAKEQALSQQINDARTSAQQAQQDLSSALSGAASSSVGATGSTSSTTGSTSSNTGSTTANTSGSDSAFTAPIGTGNIGG